MRYIPELRGDALLYFAAVAIIAAVVIPEYLYARAASSRCDVYTPSRSALVAHAGGGLPYATYTNSIAALDLAAAHRFRVVELDFQLIDGRIRLGHDKLSGTTFAELLQWLRKHPDVTVITDAKTPNVPTLTEIVREAGPLRSRFRPQIYAPAEYSPIARLGMLKPVLTVYRIGDGWQSAANSLDLEFVTVPVERKDEARGVNHPIFLHTVNKPMPGFGLYTDCLIPR